MPTPSFDFYSDPALTTVASGLSFVVSTAGGYADAVVYLGSPAGLWIKSSSSPGVDPITCTWVPGAGGIPASAVRLATSSAGLAAATPGAALVLPTTIPGGIDGAVEIHCRVTLAAMSAATYAMMSLAIGSVIEAV